MTKMTREKFEDTCYHAYQLHWMLSHGYSLLDLKDILTGLVVEDLEEDPLRTPIDETSIRAEADCATERFLYDVGFNGSLYVCKDEFLGTEYMDAGYMRMLTRLMPESNKMFALWKTFSGALEMSKILTISTAHISDETAEILDDEDAVRDMALTVYPKGEYGWFIYKPEDIETGRYIPGDLAECLKLAEKNNCQWLCLDRDAPEAEGLEIKR